MTHTPIASLILLIALLSHNTPTTHSFTTSHPFIITPPTTLKPPSSSSSSIIPLYSTNPDFDDLSPSEDETEACQDLASEFYRQVRVREQEGRLTTNTNDEETDNRRNAPRQSTTELDAPPVTTRSPSSSSFNTQSPSGDGGESQTPKFTGRNLDSPPPPPTPRRERDNTSPFSTSPFPEGQPTPRESMMRSEFNLVSLASSTQSIKLQAILIVLALGFTLYVGFSGGITDGADRFGGIEDVVEGFMGESMEFPIVGGEGGGGVLGDGSAWI